MLNKSKPGQGSNDEYKHLIQVNAREDLIYTSYAWNIFKQTQEKFSVRFVLLFLGQWKGLWPISVWNGIFSHDSLLN
jgi:hypothetical protein